jgi:hypothetical protein
MSQERLFRRRTFRGNSDSSLAIVTMTTAGWWWRAGSMRCQIWKVELRVFSLDGFTPGRNFASGTSRREWEGWRRASGNSGRSTKGWWRITNVVYAYTRALDGGRGWAGVVPLGNFNQGGCRLVNSYLGDLSSLTAVITGREPVISLPFSKSTWRTRLADRTSSGSLES